MQYDGNHVQWTWIHGDSLPNIPGSYGTYPGGRHYSLGWAPSSDTLYIMGGLGLANSSLGTLDNKGNALPIFH
jgi:hypothetical protein